MSPLKDLVYRAGAGAGLHHTGRHRHRSDLLILVYHGVHRGSAPGHVWHFLPERALEHQLRYLRRHYQVLHVDDALDALYSGDISRPTAAVTFDDGYLNNRTVAFPILEALHVPATIYLSTGLIGTDRTLWTFEVEQWVLRSTNAVVDLSRWGPGVVRLEDEVTRRSIARVVIEELKQSGPTARRQELETLGAILAPAPGPQDDGLAMMDWTDVAQLQASGLIRFGAHTIDHEIVSRLSDSELEQQIGGSIADLGNHVRPPSPTFAYPNGKPSDFDARAPRALAAHDIRYAVSTIEGLNTRETDPYALRRVTIANDTPLWEFKLRTSGLVADLKKVVGR